MRKSFNTTPRAELEADGSVCRDLHTIAAYSWSGSRAVEIEMVKEPHFRPTQKHQACSFLVEKPLHWNFLPERWLNSHFRNYFTDLTVTHLTDLTDSVEIWFTGHLMCM